MSVLSACLALSSVIALTTSDPQLLAKVLGITSRARETKID
jgi:hypothetical protein